MRRMPVGVRSFREIRESDAYYVDKTRFIDDILSEYATRAFLFLRPEGFGKSVGMSTLDAYLNLKYRGNRWFDGLEISALRPDDPEKNSHPVIFLDLRDLDMSSLEAFTGGLRRLISRECEKHAELLDSDRIDQYGRELFQGLLNGTSREADLRRSLSLLSIIYEAHYGSKAVILVDGYDRPMMRSRGMSHRDLIVGYMASVLSSGLKGNGSLMLGVVSGVMPLPNRSVFSGLNSLRVDGMMSTDMAEDFGFTPEGVGRLCADLGRQEKLAEMLEWYGGYRFGDSEMVNPRSAMSCVDNGFETRPYWIDSSRGWNDGDVLATPDQGTCESLLTLEHGGSIPSGMSSSIALDDMGDRPDRMFDAMAMAGHLTAAPRDWGSTLSIPNREMRAVFADRLVLRNKE